MIPGEAALAAWARRHAGPTGAKPSGTQPWAVAFSGGADSTALLLAAAQHWPGQVQAFHIHHGLQAAADAFEQHAQAFCAERGIPFHSVRVQAAHRPGQSPEEAARQARYQALAELAQAHGAQWVLLGQHAQDQAETLLLALTRGAGLPGLAAMPETFERHGARFGRPWLGVNGQVLRQWLQGQGVAVVEDPTNHDQRYTRNRIRAQLLPALAAHFPAYAETLARSARHAAQAQDLLDELARDDLAQVGNPPRLKALRALSRARQANVLRHWLRQGWQAGPSEAQLTELLDQVAACATRGHRIQLKVASGAVVRDGQVLQYQPPL